MNSLQKIKNSLRFFSSKATIVILTMVVLFLALAPVVLAAQLDVGLEYGEYSGLSTQDIRISIMKIVRVALGFIGVITITIIIYGGYLWMTSGGSPEKIEKAKKILTNALIGLIIIFSAFSIVWFIINMLMGALGTPGDDFGPPNDGCEGCDALGNGILESVYPFPLQEDVARNTSITVTFKVAMDPATLVDDKSGNGIYGDCKGLDGKTADECDTIATHIEKVNGNNVAIPNIKIYPYLQHADDNGESTYIQEDNVRVIASAGNRIFTFRLKNAYFDADTWYQTRLTNDIQQSNGDPAFGQLATGFAWRFLVGNRIDLDPPEIASVFPKPDDQGDDYGETEGTQAVFNLKIESLPKFAVVSGTDGLTVEPDDLGASISSTNIDGIDSKFGVCAVISGNDIEIHKLVIDANNEFECTGQSQPGTSCFLNSVSNLVPGAGAGSINIGCGILLNLPGRVESGTIKFYVWPNVEADTLTVGTKKYTFSNSASLKPNEIAVETSLDTQADSISDKLIEDLDQLPFNITPATSYPYKIKLTVKQAGISGNHTPIISSGSWANISLATPGSNSEFGSIVSSNGIEDEPRNAIITFDFNEAMRPDQIFEVDSVTGAPTNIIIEYNDTKGTLDNTDDDEWTVVDGQLFISNLYRSIDFVPNSQCGVCDGTTNPCSENKDCGADEKTECKGVENSCGEKIYCLPVNPGVCSDGASCFSDLDCASGTCDYRATNYRVRIKTADLQTCTDDTSCAEDDFGSCSDIGAGFFKGCRGTFSSSDTPTDADGNMGTIVSFYPQCSDSAPNGIIDAANNIMNGNKNTYLYNDNGAIRGAVEGNSIQSTRPTSTLDIYVKPRATSDDLQWEFYINKDLDLSPPNIIETKPNVLSREVSLKSSIDGLFDELLMSSTVKPGSNYRDGLCSCDPTKNITESDGSTSNKECADGEICDLLSKRCENPEAEQIYCWEDKDCNGGICHNKKFLSLIDPRRRIAYWITKSGLDVPNSSGFTDGYNDQTKAHVEHTRFSETSPYHTEMGFGIKDVYQNCFLPSAGPSTLGHCSATKTTSCESDRFCPTGEKCVGYFNPGAASDVNTCGVDRVTPYCCNGEAMNQADWEASSCFTGY